MCFVSNNRNMFISAEITCNGNTKILGEANLTNRTVIKKSLMKKVSVCLLQLGAHAHLLKLRCINQSCAH